MGCLIRIAVVACFLGSLGSCDALFVFGPGRVSQPVGDQPPSVGSSNVALAVPSRITGVAPLSVHFDATGSMSVLTAYPYRDILFSWNFGDPVAGPTGLWSMGARAGTLSKNADSGPVAAHVFETPGDYTVTLACYNGSSTYGTTVSIHVDDPEIVYAGPNTVCVSTSTLPVAGVDGVPTGALCFLVSTVEAATAKITGPNQRLLFHRTETFTVSGANFLPSHPGLTVGAYGTGAKPLVRFIGSTVNYGAFCVQAPDNRIMDLAFDTSMPEFLVSGGTKYSARPVNASSASDHTLVERLDCTHVSSIAFLGGHHSMVVDCSLQNAGGNAGNVGIWYFTPGIGGALLGNSIIDCTKIEHNIRTHLASKTVIAHNSLAIPAAGKHLLTVRGQDNLSQVPPLAPEWTELVLVSDNRFGSDTEAGGSLQVAPTATGFNEPIRNILIEKNLFSGPSASPSHAGFDTGPGLVFRNNIFLVRGGTTNGFEFVSLNHSNLDGSPTASDAWIVNNSAFSDHVGNFTFLQMFAYALPDPHDIHVLNNLVYVPYAVKNTGQNGVPNLASVAPRISALVWGNSTDSQVKSVFPGWVTDPPASTADFRLQIGSYGVGQGVPAPVMEDFFGDPRTGAMDLGAVRF